jgi:acyl carrier protein
VLEGATRAVRPGGCIFLGDVRNFRLLAAIHASVQLHKAPATLTRDQLRVCVQNHARQERELLIDPAFFTALQHHLPTISRVDVELKRGRHHNELTRFRYDVVLHTVGGEHPAAEPEALDWQDADLTPAGVPRQLQRCPAAGLCLVSVPNARLWSEMKTLELLDAPAGPPTANDLREAVRAAGPVGIDPEDFWALGSERGYAVEVRCSTAGRDSCYDVVFRPPAPAGVPSRNGKVHAPAAMQPARSWSSYANDPLRGKAVRDLVPQLRDHVKGSLPEYMVPSAYVVLDALPLTPSGKLDRNALPAPDSARPLADDSYLAPRNRVEEAVAKIWAEVLGVERVGAHDNFFDLGGHSLLATQVLSRIRQAFPVDISLRRLFEEPTVATLARAVTEGQGESTNGAIGKVTPDDDEVLSDLDRMSDDEVDSLLQGALAEEEVS